MTGIRYTYQAAPTGSTTTLLDLIAVTADLHQHCSQSLCFGHQALQELGPASCVSAHGRVDAADILVVVGPFIADIAEIELEFVVGVSVDADVEKIVVQQLRHAIDGAFDGDVSVEQRGAICAVIEQAVEFVDVLHGDSQTLVAEEHVLEALVQVLVCALQEAIELVDMFQEDVGDVGGRLLEALVQQMDAEDNLGDCLEQGMVLALGVVTPMAAVRVVVRGLGGISFPAHELLASLDASASSPEGHEASLARGIEHGLVKRRLHRRQGVDGEGRGHDGRVARLVPCEGITAVFEARPAALGESAKREHGISRIAAGWGMRRPSGPNSQRTG